MRVEIVVFYTPLSYVLHALFSLFISNIAPKVHVFKGEKIFFTLIRHRVLFSFGTSLSGDISTFFLDRNFFLIANIAVV